MPLVPEPEIRQALSAPDAAVTTAAQVASWLPREAADAHKGSCGYGLVVAGSVNYTGAAYFAGAAALRAGAGLVTIALPGSLHPIIAGLLPEATYLALPENLGVLARSGAAVVHESWGRYRALLVGPGLTTQRPAAEFLAALLAGGRSARPRPTEAIGFDAARREVGARSGARAMPEQTGRPEDDTAAGADSTAAGADGPGADGPAAWVVDADALNWLAEQPARLSDLPPASVLTPHPGEMARLTGASAAAVNADRLTTARRAATEWGHVVVLKGALTIVAAPDGRATVNPFANPALATAGSGDVLAGTITGLFAQGMPPFEAAAAGAYVHALAGELAARAVGRRGVTAGDVLARVAGALVEVEGE